MDETEIACILDKNEFWENNTENLNFMNKIRMDLELLEQFLFHCGNDIMSLLEKENSVRFI